MQTYFLMLTLTPEGRAASLEDPERLLRIEAAIKAPGVQTLGLYGVLGECDFISMVEAEDNESLARFSLEFGVRAGAHITSLPAIPISRFERRSRDGSGASGRGIGLELPEALAGGGPPAGAR